MRIAKEAGVANSSLFTYFKIKTDLFNQLYLELKTEMATAAMKDMRENEDLRSGLAVARWQLRVPTSTSLQQRR
jgi:AcrR family transcriptional regulator